jgi:hypothetical protein
MTRTTIAAAMLLALAMPSSPLWAYADGCAEVLKTPDGFLNLREAPMMGTKVVVRLKPGDKLSISDQSCEKRGILSICNESMDWTRVDSVERLDGKPGKNIKPNKGWVGTKFLRFEECGDSTAISPAMGAEEKIRLCHAGLIKLGSFAEHLKLLRRYKERGYDIDELIERQRKGGPDFFSSQIIVQENLTGSGTYDLRMFHGLSNAQDYRNVTAWDCQAADFPIVYFVGFRVRKIENATIFVSREKDIVNVISLNALDPILNNHIKVQLFESPEVLCPDIATGCDHRIFYDRREY